MSGLQSMNKRPLSEIKGKLALTADMYFIELVYFVFKCLPFRGGHSQPISCDLAAFARTSLIQGPWVIWYSLSKTQTK
jgi:hypothetical protein